MLRCLIHAILWLTSKLIWFIYFPKWIYYNCKSPKRCPSVYDDIYFMPATILADKIRKQEVTSEYTVNAYIARIKEINPILNAVVEERFEDALAEAKYVDGFIQSSNMSFDELNIKYPLLGVPITIKESIKVAGMSNNAGCKNSSAIKAKTDATCVKQLKLAGVIILLVSNTPEMCLNWETFNYATGRTLNPYDTRRVSGGSSGGEAALLASCGSVIGLGSDLVGSLRIPPLFCGVYGHRPTAGTIALDGHNPKCRKNESVWTTAFIFGPLTRYSIDLSLMLQIIAKPNKRDSLRLDEEFDPKQIKIYYMLDNGMTCMSNSVNIEIKSKMLSLFKHLLNEGFYVEEIQIEELGDSIDLAFLPLFELDMDSVFDGKDKSVSIELIRSLFCCPTVTFTSIFLLTFKFFYKCLMTEKRREKNYKLLEELKKVMIDRMGENGVFVYPGFTNVAHIHGEIYTKTLDTAYLGIFSVLGFPVTICPIGLNSSGLPIGVQLVAAPNNDRLTLAMAREIEQTFTGWIPPTFTKNDFV